MKNYITCIECHQNFQVEPRCMCYTCCSMGVYDKPLNRCWICNRCLGISRYIERTTRGTSRAT